MSVNENRVWSKVDVNFPKYLRFIIFVVFVFLLLESMNKISNFFYINPKSGFTYLIWVSLLFFLFVLLPIKRSAFSREA